MRRNVEAAGVHLADCTLLMYQGELEHEIRKLENGTRSVPASSMHSAISNGGLWQKKLQEASPYIRVDGELISSNIAMANAIRADHLYTTAKSEFLRKEEARVAVFNLHDEVRASIIDEWALGYERIQVQERKHLVSTLYREKSREALERNQAMVNQHLADEAMLWAAEAQVLEREMAEGRAAYKRSIIASTGRKGRK